MSRFFSLPRLNYNCTIVERFWRTIVAIGCIVTAILVTYSRVYLLYHSKSQVFCGALLGIALGTAWFIIVHTVLTPLFPIVVSWWVIGNMWWATREQQYVRQILIFAFPQANIGVLVAARHDADPQCPVVRVHEHSYRGPGTGAKAVGNRQVALTTNYDRPVGRYVYNNCLDNEQALNNNWTITFLWLITFED